MTDPVMPAQGPEPSAGTHPAPAEASAARGSPDPPRSLPAFAAKANDLEALRGAVVDAANVSAGLWLSYLFVLLYLAIAAGSVTHRDLLLEKSVKLPFLNVELPLVPFFVMGPALFLVVHAYVLLHFMLLADKAGAFHQQLRRQIDDEDIRASLRRQLPSNVFVQFVAGPPGVRSGGVGLMFRAIAQISLIVLPVGLLMLFQLQFLPYHSEPVTWWQRIAVVIDLSLIWALWPSINRGEISRLALRDLLRWRVVAMAVVSVLVILMVGAVATFPGERLHTALPSLPIVPAKYVTGTQSSNWVPGPVGIQPEQVKFRSLHSVLVAGEVDPVTRRPISIWSNRLVLPELNIPTSSSEGFSLRGRRLEGAVLAAAKLAGVDLTGAHLEEANLDGADLSGSQLGCGAATLIEKTDPDSAKKTALHSLPDGRAFVILGEIYTEKDCVQLQGATLRNASLQGALLEKSDMHGADLTRARLHGAVMIDTKLDGASLSLAELPGATLEGAHLVGANLVGAKMYGVVFNSANLSGANLNHAELQGAQLDKVIFNGASLEEPHLWRAVASNPIRDKQALTYVHGPDFEPRYASEKGSSCKDERDRRCPWTSATFESLKKILTESVSDPGRRNDALARIRRLDPDDPQPVDDISFWRNLEKAPPSDADLRKTRVAALRPTICNNGVAAPHVLHSLLKRYHTMPELKLLAKELLDDRTCAVARSLSQHDKKVLEWLRPGKNAAE
ncbi:pentapeptide repeat-containing protein [Bradyrhizobium sp. WYCCWR 12699]|uniref:pentapeptide repeat-containing protein n=1 Tax=Bradyrhizobium sp. WYCCWR 12699 TaxID=3064203 RepID=UPI0028A3C942|nr:pentapeptide repeat-containing protein [Bradyrhizobium sp. WYCCWR 12699]MDT4741752.1 pentapeptide repeat-containing protein [Bradyrhizobium sp. WYCCWR 12699]